MAHNHGNSQHGSIDPHDLGHIVPPSLFQKVLGALLVLTVLTVVASRFNFGSWNVVVALVIASVKAVLVMLFFMHLKYEDSVIKSYVVFPIVLLCIMLLGIFIDNPFRDALWYSGDQKTVFADEEHH